MADAGPVWTFPWSPYDARGVAGPACDTFDSPWSWHADYPEPCMRCGVDEARHACDVFRPKGRSAKALQPWAPCRTCGIQRQEHTRRAGG